MRRWQTAVNLVIGLVGIGLVLYGLLVIGTRPVTCRGVEMHPGDVCHKSDFSQVQSDKVQTYEQRLASARASRPTVVGLGVGLVVFSGVLTWVARRPRPEDEARLV